MTRAIKWRRRYPFGARGPARYDAEITVSRSVALVVGHAVQSGTPGRDTYPWDWYLTDHGVARAKPGAKRHSGTTDTLASAKRQIEGAVE